MDGLKNLFDIIISNFDKEVYSKNEHLKDVKDEDIKEISECIKIIKEFDKENDGKVTKMFYEELAKAFIEKLRELLAHGKIIVPLFVKDEEQFLQIAKYISSAETFLNLQNLIKDYNGDEEENKIVDSRLTNKKYEDEEENVCFDSDEGSEEEKAPKPVKTVAEKPTGKQFSSDSSSSSSKSNSSGGIKKSESDSSISQKNSHSLQPSLSKSASNSSSKSSSSKSSSSS